MDDIGIPGRFGAELAMLRSMYPQAISYSPPTNELTYTCDTSSDYSSDSGAGVLTLRIPGGYPEEGLPEVVAATGPRKMDLRDSAQERIRRLGVAAGEEVLDPIILAFQDLVSSQVLADGADVPIRRPVLPEFSTEMKTVVIWLHQLMNPKKRQLALHPTQEIPTQPISGLVRAGAPGIMVFSGPKESVDAHVAELRSLKWQAFQVRYDSAGDLESDDDSDLWQFVHGKGIREVDEIEDLSVEVEGEHEREVLLSCVGVL